MIPRMTRHRRLQIHRCSTAGCSKNCRNPPEEQNEDRAQNLHCRCVQENLRLLLEAPRRIRRAIHLRKMYGQSRHRHRHGLQIPLGRRRILRDHRRIGHWEGAREHGVREEERMYCVVARQIGSPLLERKNRVHLIGYQP